MASLKVIDMTEMSSVERTMVMRTARLFPLVVSMTGSLLADAGTAQEATETESAGSWFTWDYATGDWGGARTGLENAGVTPELNFLVDWLSNVDGGLSEGSATAYQLYGSVTFDLEKLAKIPGLSFYFSAAQVGGDDLSAENIGNIFDVAEAFTGEGARLGQTYFLQSFAQDTFELAIGRLASGDDFAAIDSFGNYVSAAVNGHPGSIGVNFPSFTSEPSASWGLRATANFPGNVSWSAAAYNADPSVQDDDEHGVDFSFSPEDGVLALTEISFSTNQDNNANGLPGQYLFGLIYDSSDYPKLSDPDQFVSDNFGFYAIAEQMVYREGGPGSTQGLTAWAALTVNPDESINALPVAVFAGLGYQGLFKSRNNDITSAGLFYGDFSNDLAGQSKEFVIELNHRFQILPSTYITPDFQYVINPNGGGIPDAVVVGLEASIDF